MKSFPVLDKQYAVVLDEKTCLYCQNGENVLLNVYIISQQVHIIKVEN